MSKNKKGKIVTKLELTCVYLLYYRLRQLGHFYFPMYFLQCFMFKKITR